MKTLYDYMRESENNEEDVKNTILEMTIEEMDLSVRSYNLLKRANIHTVKELTNKTEKDIVKNCKLGKKGFNEVVAKLVNFLKNENFVYSNNTTIYMGTPIEEMDLSVRSYNCLKRANINTVEDLIKKTEDDLLKVNKLKKEGVNEIVEKLASIDLRLEK